MAFNFKYSPKQVSQQVANQAQAASPKEAAKKKGPVKNKKKKMNFTVFYEQEGYRIDIPKLMGRNAAGALLSPRPFPSTRVVLSFPA